MMFHSCFSTLDSWVDDIFRTPLSFFSFIVPAIIQTWYVLIPCRNIAKVQAIRLVLYHRLRILGMLSTGLVEVILIHSFQGVIVTLRMLRFRSIGNGFKFVHFD